MKIDGYAHFFASHIVGWGNWNDHILGWWKHKDDPNVLFLKYEDLQKVFLYSNDVAL